MAKSAGTCAGCDSNPFAGGGAHAVPECVQAVEFAPVVPEFLGEVFADAKSGFVFTAMAGAHSGRGFEGVEL